jgi:hypothetical protein
MLLIILSVGIMMAKLCAVFYLTTLPVAEHIASAIDERNVSVDYWWKDTCRGQR